MTNTKPTIRRITGPSCNFITAITQRVWAFNHANESRWQKIKENDLLVLHQTKDDYKLGKRLSSIIGFAVVGSARGEKTDFWWADEVEDQELRWPYWIDLKAIYLFGDVHGVDTTKQVHQKSIERLKAESDAISRGAVPLANIDELGIAQGIKTFPRNGSTSAINEGFLPIILRLAEHPPEQAFEYDEETYEVIAKSWNKDVSTLSKDAALLELRNYKRAPNKGHHKNKTRTALQRIEDQRQKSLVALIEDYTCQVCGFHQSYVNGSGEIRYIIDIDHINEKHRGGGEDSSNLWALCPNCHRKKTAGIIKVDLKSQTVIDDRKIITIRDHHLFIP